MTKTLSEGKKLVVRRKRTVIGLGHTTYSCWTVLTPAEGLKLALGDFCGDGHRTSTLTTLNNYDVGCQGHVRYADMMVILPNKLMYAMRDTLRLEVRGCQDVNIPCADAFVKGKFHLWPPPIMINNSVPPGVKSVHVSALDLEYLQGVGPHFHKMANSQIQSPLICHPSLKRAPGITVDFDPKNRSCMSGTCFTVDVDIRSFKSSTPKALAVSLSSPYGDDIGIDCGEIVSYHFLV